MKKIILVFVCLFVVGCSNSFFKGDEHNTGVDGLLNERESFIQGYLYNAQANIETELNALSVVEYHLQSYDANIIGVQSDLKKTASEKRKLAHQYMSEANELEFKSRKYGNLRNLIGQTMRDLKLFRDPIINELKLTTDDLKTLPDTYSVTGVNILDPKTPKLIKLNSEAVQRSFNTKFKINDLIKQINTLGGVVDKK